MSLEGKINYDDAKSVVGIQFGILSPEQILRDSVAHIYKPLVRYEDPVMTLIDPRLGSNGQNKINQTTKLSRAFDPGCFGHLIPAKPVYNPLMFEYARHIVALVCPICSSMRSIDKLNKNDPATRASLLSKGRMTRFSALKKQLANKGTKCTECGALLPKISDDKERIFGLIAEYKTEGGSGGAAGASGGGATVERQQLDTDQVHRILRHISDEDCELIGFDPKLSHPSWMIWTVIPIPPPTIRPSVQADNGKMSEDDLTSKLNDLIKHNEKFAELLSELSSESTTIEGPTAATISKMWETLQWHVATLIDNQKDSYHKATNRTHRPLKTLAQRLKGKTGRIRGNLNGKRGDMSARSVITADPNLSINQLGVPKEIAMILTIPEIVTKFNIDKLLTLVRNGPDKYPGAVQIKTKGTNFRKSILPSTNLATIQIGVGDVVYRHLLDGDPVLFNRQPTLRDVSMMGHFVKVLPGKTFRFNAQVTPPYNADFDGDEMNMHVPQSKQTINEVRQLSVVSNKIVTAQNSKPVIGAVQDSLVGLYRMSSEHVCGKPVDYVEYIGQDNFERIQHFMRLVGWLSNYSGRLPTPHLNHGAPEIGWTPRQLLSMIFPKISVRDDPFDKKEKDPKYSSLSIKHGHFEEPEPGKKATPIGKKLAGKSAINGIFHIAWNDYGPTITRDLLDDLSRVTCQWHLIKGFTVGISDLEIDQATLEESEVMKLYYLEKSKRLIDGLHTGDYENVRNEVFENKNPRGLAKSDKDQFELDIMYVLGECNKDLNKLVEVNLASIRSTRADGTPGELRDNKIESMINSGSKGSFANTLQIISALCQQDINGKRIQDGYTRRPTPHIPKDDLTPQSRGFILNSYMRGLNYLEFIYHAIAGRMGVISTSIKTAETGYVQRRLVKVMEALSVKYDGTTRNANNVITQFSYAGDGFDGAKIEGQKLAYIGYSREKFVSEYRHSDSDEGDNLLALALTRDAFEKYIDDRESEQASMVEEFNQLVNDRERILQIYKSGIPERFYSPVNFGRLVKNLYFRLGVSARRLSDLTPKTIITKVQDLVSYLKETNISTPDVGEHSLFIFTALLRANLSSKNLIYNNYFTEEVLDHLISEIKTLYHKSMITPGDSIGLISAQSIGEPSTQMTLNTFHHAGIGAKANVSRGVPRLREIMAFSNNPKTPAVTIYLNKTVLRNMRINYDGSEMSMVELNRVLADVPESDLKRVQDLIEGQYVRNIKQLKSGLDWLEFGDLIVRTEIIYDPDDLKSFITEDVPFLRAYWEFMKTASSDDCSKSPWVIRFELDREKMADHGIQVYELENKIKAQMLQIGTCIISDDNSRQIICRARLGETEDDTTDPMTIMERVQAALSTVRIKGVPNIEKTSIRVGWVDIEKDDGAVISVHDSAHSEESKRTLFGKDYMIDTVGSNLLQILNLDFVDPYRTVSNKIQEVYQLFGIEAARKLVIAEIKDVMDYADADVGIRHITLLADVMTSQGILQSVDRFGVKKSDSGPLARASFEEATKEMARAAAFAEDDNMRGVTESVIFGQVVKVGTGAFDICMDEKMMMEFEDEEEEDDYEDDSKYIAAGDSCTNFNMRYRS
jgi:DNA-directed RNA polymerase II subunit RPB1